jgi:hypothetical protein
MKRLVSPLAIVLMVAGAACHRQPDVEKVPVGTEVDVTKQDGGVVHGTLKERDDKAVKLEVEGAAERTVLRNQIADVRIVDRNTPEKRELPPSAKYREMTLVEGTRLGVRHNDSVSSETSRVEDRIEATVIQPVVVHEIEVVPAGSVVKGEVASVAPAGKVKGRASLALRFRTLEIDGESYPISSSVAEMAPATKGEDAKKVGIPAAGGAVIGGLIGGKKGAAVGAVVGGGAGAATVLATPGKEVVLAKGSVLSIRLESPVDVRVPIKK